MPKLAPVPEQEQEAVEGEALNLDSPVFPGYVSPAPTSGDDMAPGDTDHQVPDVGEEG